MLNLKAPFERRDDPFVLHLAQNLLDHSRLRSLYESTPRGTKRIVRTEASHEKQYAMNLLYLVENDARNRAAALTSEWSELLDDLESSAFREWLEAGTGLRLRHLPTDIGVYTHDDGDFITVHKDKPTKALTAVLYLNDRWPEDAGGHYEIRRSGDGREAPVRTIPPSGGQLLAFPPTQSSWHAVSPVTTGGTLTRLTVQIEFWFEKNG
jgi:SM-20-related protein